MAMTDKSQEIKELISHLTKAEQNANEQDFEVTLGILQQSAQKIGKAWSGSRLGYHANVYYKNFDKPPTGTFFSRNWGLQDEPWVNDTCGDWIEYDADEVRQRILSSISGPDLDRCRQIASIAKRDFDHVRSELLAILAIEPNADSVLEGYRAEIADKRIYSVEAIASAMPEHLPSQTQDHRAAQEGPRPAPHLIVTAEIAYLRQCVMACQELSVIATRVVKHLDRLRTHSKASVGGNLASVTAETRRVGGQSDPPARIFIGHGQSNVWRELKDFLERKLGLEWEEFNRIPAAGYAHKERLVQMLDSSSFAFVILTAEDQAADGNLNPRLNAVHEIGLFQGRLGFERAIILLEEGCGDFSNIHGLNHIPFPAGKIKAAFEDIRDVLADRGLLSAKGDED
jgi:predicted nucleotide-binding protein